MLISKIIRRLITHVEVTGDEDVFFIGMDTFGYAKNYDSFKIKEFSTEWKALIGVSSDEEG